MLVCTTIVESGLDIASANTLIVERADELGLAQLYQIRGRVGRSRERAYAYLLYPSAAALSEDARGAAVHALGLHGARLRLQDRDARPRDPRRRQSARATSSRATWRRSASSSTWGCSTRRCALLAADAAEEAPEPVRMDVPVDAYVPGDYVPYEAAKIEMHRRVAGAREVADLILLREELEDRFGPVPEPLDNLIRLQDARIKLGRAGARTVDFRAGRMAVAPIDLDSAGARALRERIPEVVYESGRSTVRVRVPEDAAERFPAVVAAAEAILEVATRPEPTP